MDRFLGDIVAKNAADLNCVGAVIVAFEVFLDQLPRLHYLDREEIRVHTAKTEDRMEIREEGMAEGEGEGKRGIEEQSS